MIDYTKDILTNEQLIEVARVIATRLQKERTGHRSYGMTYKVVLKSIKSQQKRLFLLARKEN